MWKKIFISVGAIVLIIGALLWFNRTSVLLFIASNVGKAKVAAYQPVEWEQGPETSLSSPSERPPNIVFILVDDVGINDISTFGGGVAGGRVPTPNIDRLAQGGAVFVNGYAGSATCAPSRAILMTGRYPSRTGYEFTPMPDGMARLVARVTSTDYVDYGFPPLRFNPEKNEADTAFIDKGLPSEEVTVAELLRLADYHNVHIGKWHLGRAPSSRAASQGFDESLMMASGLYLEEDDPDAVNAKLDFDPLDKFLWARMQFAVDFDRSGGELVEEWFEPDGYLTDYFTDEALKVIEANKNRPFFLYLAHWGTHTPLQATRQDYEAVGDIEPHRLRVYAAMLRSLDRSVGRVLDKLEEEGLTDNTIIIFTSDNGGAGYLGLHGMNDPYRGWKSTFFEGGIRVPYLVKWPARIAPGTVVEDPVSHVDLLPTLAAVTGVTVPENLILDGKNIMPLATDEALGDNQPERALYWSGGFYKAVRAGDWKLQIDERQNKQWLYNLSDDPVEKIDLSKVQPDKLKEMQALVEAHWRDAKPPLYPHVMEWPVRVDETTTDPYDSDDEYVIWAN